MKELNSITYNRTKIETFKLLTSEFLEKAISIYKTEKCDYYCDNCPLTKCGCDYEGNIKDKITVWLTDFFGTK